MCLGRCSLDYVERVLRVHLLRTLAADKPRHHTQLSTMSSPAGDGLPEERRILIWLRQSSVDHAAPIATQLWAMLTRTCPALPYFTSDDKITIAIEYCSSSSHPMSDRKLVQRLLPLGSYTHVLTVNPDRLTRRADEVDQALTLLKDAAWWTRGCRSEHTQEADWHCINPPPAWQDYKVKKELIEEQLERGRYIPLQFGFYSLCIHAMIRLLEAPLIDESLIALQAALKLFCEAHGVEQLIFYARTSPQLYDVADKHQPVSSLNVNTTFWRLCSLKQIDPFRLLGHNMSPRLQTTGLTKLRAMCLPLIRRSHICLYQRRWIVLQDELII